MPILYASNDARWRWTLGQRNGGNVDQRAQWWSAKVSSRCPARKWRGLGRKRMDLVRICEDMICLNYQTKRVVVFVECGSSYTYIYIYVHINTLNVLGLQWVRQWGFLDLKILQEVFQNLTSLQCYQSKLYIASAKHFYVGDHRSPSPWDLLFYFHSLQVTNAYHSGFTAWMGFRSEEMQDDPFPLEGLAGVASVGCMI